MKTISHATYENLRSYPAEPYQLTVYRDGGFHRSLIAAGFLRLEDGGARMTDAGRAALAAYRERWGVSR